jgi:hypothetical protein
VAAEAAVKAEVGWGQHFLLDIYRESVKKSACEVLQKCGKILVKWIKILVLLKVENCFKDFLKDLFFP